MRLEESIENLKLIRLIRKVNGPCAASGTRFTAESRRKAIISLAHSSRTFAPILDDGFNLVYGGVYNKARAVVLISCRLDYPVKEEDFLVSANKSCLIGTLDNSVCTGLVLDLLRRDMLPGNVVLAFTAGEERGKIGAREIIRQLNGGKLSQYSANLAAVMALDITLANADKAVSLENISLSQALMAKTSCTSAKAFWELLGGKLSAAGVPFGVLMEGLPDEADFYANLGAVSFCLPVQRVIDRNRVSGYDLKKVRVVFETMRSWQRGLCKVAGALAGLPV